MEQNENIKMDSLSLNELEIIKRYAQLYAYMLVAKSALISVTHLSDQISEEFSKNQELFHNFYGDSSSIKSSDNPYSDIPNYRISNSIPREDFKKLVIAFLKDYDPILYIYPDNNPTPELNYSDYTPLLFKESDESIKNNDKSFEINDFLGWANDYIRDKGFLYDILKCIPKASVDFGFKSKNSRRIVKL